MKKGQVSLDKAPSLIITLGALALIMGSLGIMLSSFRDSSGMSQTLSIVETGDTFVASNGTNVDFADADAITCSNVAIYNTSTVLTQNFTISNCNALLFEPNVDGQTVSVNYTKTISGRLTQYNATTNGLNSVLNFSEQVPNVGTILGVTLIIISVLGAFALFLRGQGNVF